MKAVKLSLAAALVASSAFALEDVKFSGQAKLWYQTTDKDQTAGDDLFKQNANTIGQALLKVGVTGKAGEKVGFGATVVSIDTIGLENNLVGGTTVGGAAALANQTWAQEAFLTYTTGNTTAKIGRQKLDTPLAFSEDWNVVENSFNAAVLLNKDIPNTTLVLASVGAGNGYGQGATTANWGKGFTVVEGGTFTNYYGSGAYAAGAINNSIDGVTAQAWYYDVVDIATAYWLQADAKLPMGLTFGAQYANVDVAKKAATALSVPDEATTAYAVKIAGKIADYDLYAAYSSVDKGTLAVANTATGFKKTKLYTASIFSDGTVAAQSDVKAYKVGGSTTVSGLKVAASYGNYEGGANAGSADLVNNTVNEIDLSVSTKVDVFNVAAHFINRSDDLNKAALNHDTIRIIASLDF